MTIIILFIGIAICGFFITAIHNHINDMDDTIYNLLDRVERLEGEEDDKQTDA